MTRYFSKQNNLQHNSKQPQQKTKVFHCLMLLLVACISSQAQNIAINETGNQPDTSAMLDISSTSRGLLIPRMNKAQKNAIALPGVGLLVFQTAPDSIGFHYYDGTQWLWLAAANNKQGWLTTGNAGTDSIINFLGTTDDKPVMLRQNNLPAGQLNTKTHNYFIGGGAGVNNTSTQNTGFGDSALNKNTTGSGNTAIGYRSMVGSGPVTGDINTAIGNNTLSAITSGYQNIAIGNNALTNMKSGWQNIVAGAGAMENATKGEGNIALGSWALRSNDSASFNIAIGTNALYSNDSARNTAIGHQALYYNNRNSNTAVGYVAGYLNNYLQAGPLQGIENTYIGYASGYAANTGSKNVAIGNRAMLGGVYFLNSEPNNDYYKRNVAVGDSAMVAGYGSDNVAVGFKTLSKSDYTSQHVAIGSRALENTTATYPNTAIGYSSQDSNTTAGGNTSLGSYSLTKNTAGFNNTAIGNAAMYEAANTSNAAFMFDNTAVGNDALRLARYSGETALGAGALRNDTGSKWNTALGYLSMYNHLNGNANTAVGTSALRFDITGVQNTALGTNGLFNHKRGDNNLAAGMNALFNDTASYQNTAVGAGTMFNHKSGDNNVAMGFNALWSDTSGGGNIALGAYSMFSHLKNNNNTAIGTESMAYDINGDLNTAMGWRSLRYAKNPFQNTAIGVGALELTDSSLYNTAVGRGAMMGKGGRHNTAIGFYASGAHPGVPTTNYYVNETTSIGYMAGYKNIADYNTFVGTNAGFGGTDSLRGIENTGMGAYALYFNTNGSSNTAVGIGTMYGTTTGRSNTALGTRALGYSATYNYNVAIGDSAMFTNNANANLAVGTFSMRTNNTGEHNAATGNFSLMNNSTGSRNVAVGDSALFVNNSGSNNTTIGYRATTGASNLLNATAIGSNAYVAQNNSLVLGSINGTNGATADTKVGIGTTNPDSTFSVANKLSVGSNGTMQFDNSVSVMNYLFKSGSGNADRMLFAHSPANPNSGIEYQDASDKFNFLNNATEVLTVDLANQRTGIATPNPDSSFSVANKFSVGSSGTIQFDNTVPVMNYMFKSGSGNANRMLFAHSPSFSTWGLQYQDVGDKFHFLSGGTGVMTVDLNTQRVGIGVTSPTHQLQLSTDDAAKLTTSVWNITSDMRLKTLDGNYTKGLKDILQLNTIMYHYAKGNARNLATDAQGYGFSAQEVQKIFPEAVNTEKDGYLSLNIHPILVAYVNAFKEQQQQIETLQKEVETEKNNTKAAMEQLQQQLQALEKKLESIK